MLYVGPFGPWVIARLGKKRGFLLACAGAVVGGAIVLIGRTTIPVALVGLAIIGISMALLNTMTWALEADTVEYGEWQTGIRTEGATYAAFSFTRKVGQAFGVGLVGYALGFFGYVSASNGHVATQTQHTLDGIMLTMAVLPAVFFVLALVIMWTYPLTEARHAEIVAELKERHAAGLSAAHRA